MGSPRPWPPEAADELAELLDGERFLDQGPKAPSHLGLWWFLEEFELWLADERAYEEAWHKWPWRSMVSDLRLGLDDAGERLRAVLTSAARLQSELADGLGADYARRARCSQLAGDLRAELGTTAACVAAFDDLVAAVVDESATPLTVTRRREALRATLLAANRAPGTLWTEVAGVLRDSAWSVALAHHRLEGGNVEGLAYGRDAANLPWNERLSLCRRLLTEPVRSAHHVVWMAYDFAQFRWPHWYVELGPLTFFRGSALLGLLEVMDGGEDAPGHVPVPHELLTVEGRRAAHWPATATELERDWVAVRADLGVGAFDNPVALARETTEGLVGLAAFHGQGTSWQRLAGYFHVVDDVISSSGSFGPVENRPFPESDLTDYQLSILSSEIPGWLPGKNRSLDDVFRLAGALGQGSSLDEPLGLIQDVRVIETISSKADVRRWADFLEDSLSIHWARTQVVTELFGAVEPVVRDPELQRLAGNEDFAEIHGRLWVSNSSRPRGVTLHHDVALESLGSLPSRVPAHHRNARKLTYVAERLSSVQALAQWVDDLMEEHAVLVERVARSRNSMAHGGPYSLQVSRAVRPFARDQAGTATAFALRGALQGQTAAEAFAGLRSKESEWRSAIPLAPSTADALFPR